MAGPAKKKYLKLAKGFYSKAKKCIKIEILKVEKWVSYACRNRKIKFKEFRYEWNGSISRLLHDHGFTYSLFVNIPTYLTFSSIERSSHILL
jgi:large subunit ribosomal protein L20